jgi:hypothetical protein
MTRPWQSLLVACTMACALPADGAAQYTALPVHVSPNIDPRLRTVMIAGDVGLLRENQLDYTPLATRLVANLGRISLTAGVGVLHHSDADDEFTFGAGVGYDLYASSPRKPTMTFHGGAGHVRIAGPFVATEDRWDFPVGVAFAWYLPALDLNAEPWIAPRAHLRLTEFVAETGHEADFGIGSSLGLNLTHAVGPGIHLAMDALYIEGARTGNARVEWVLGAGIHFKVALP